MAKTKTLRDYVMMGGISGRTFMSGRDDNRIYTVKKSKSASRNLNDDRDFLGKAENFGSY